MTEQERILIETEDRSKSNSHRIDGIETEIKEIKKENKILHDLMTSVKVIAEKMSSIEEKVDEVKSKTDANCSAQREFETKFTKQLNEIKNAPASQLFKNWNQVKVAVVTAVATLFASSAAYVLVNYMAQK